MDYDVDMYYEDRYALIDDEGYGDYFDEYYEDDDDYEEEEDDDED